MAEGMLKPAGTDRIRFGLAGAVAILYLVAGVTWGGVVGGDMRVAFWIGVAVLIVMLALYAFAFWHLLVRPLPATHKVPEAQSIKASYRQAIALLLGISCVNIVVGAFWDELWHRTYGLPFGEDFFWRPHLLMYFGFISVTMLGFVGLYIIVRQIKGTFQQRFRATPVVGLLVLVAAFTMYVLPADPLWHTIYGNDITAWSIPHILLVMNFTTMMLVAVAIQMSMVPVREWRSIARITFYDVLPLVMFACITLINLQLYTTEYDQLTPSSQHPILNLRPDWVLPFLIAAIVPFVGVLANHSLRYFGAATATGLLALGLRLAFIRLFDAEMLRTNAWLVGLLPLLAIDVWYGYCVLRKRTPTWLGGGLAGSVGMAVAYPLMTQLYPAMVISNPAVMAVMVLAASLSASWLAEKIGDYIATKHKQVEEGEAQLRVPLASVGVLVALAAFIIFFVNTAAPPM